MTVKRVLAVLAVSALAGCGGGGTPAEHRNTRARAATGDILVAAAWPVQRRRNLLFGQGLEMAVDEVNSTASSGPSREGHAGRRIETARPTILRRSP